MNTVTGPLQSTHVLSEMEMLSFSTSLSFVEPFIAGLTLLQECVRACAEGKRGADREVQFWNAGTRGPDGQSQAFRFRAMALRAAPLTGQSLLVGEPQRLRFQAA